MRHDPLKALKTRKRLDEAAESLMADDLAMAEALYEAVLVDEPGHVGALHGLAVLRVRGGRLEEGERGLRETLQRAPEVPRYWNDLGEALRLQGRGQEAKEAYRQALSLDPGLAEASNNLGIVLMQEGNLEEAEEWFMAAIAQYPDNPYPHNNLGVLRERQGRLGEALRGYETAVRLKPDFQDALDNYLDLLKAQPGLTAESLRRLGEAAKGH